ncbi:branched-chain amino acid ABC transporter permease (plasmid) [Azospirillum thermophilum]|uniref:Branched-chain amino acid ABC transporter permease n=2 Tax=Azospirillum thermophilum TaxID=2202148 RepID=A0A2S2CX29_9PROT|nr:branched-chain amino acid ABC transporter permease [Azospirillum thermophilum]
MPALVLFASYIGFGSLVSESGFGLLEGLVSTATSWALPGQVALVEMSAVGASVVAITLAVALTNARLMPMSVTLVPLLKRHRAPAWQTYALAHVIAVTSWANGLRRLPQIAEEDRMAWFFGYAGTLWLVTMLATAVGFFAAGLLPAPVTLGLVFLNPLYFLLLFAQDLRQRAKVLALAFGAVAGPLMHLVLPGYGLLVTGLAAGTAAFAVDLLLERRR